MLFQSGFQCMCTGYGGWVELFEGGIMPTELICTAPWLKVFM